MSKEPFASRLKQLQGEAAVLGNLVQGLVIESVNLLQRPDLEGLERLHDGAWQVGQMRLAIELACLNALATQGPADADLRGLIAILETAYDLERVADHAIRIARANTLTIDHTLRSPLAHLHRLASGVQAMLGRALTAFEGQDVSLAGAVRAELRHVDTLYDQVHRDLLAALDRRQRLAHQVIYLSRAAYDLRRAAERVAAMAMWVSYATLGSLGAGQPAPQQTPAEQTSVAA
jgi:phosphate transport system protein